MIVTPYNYLHSTVYRLKEAVKGTGVYGILAKIQREQYYDPGRLRELQGRRLRRLLTHAARHSPYYRRLLGANSIEIDDRFGVDKIADIPPLRREDLQTHFDEMLCDDAADIYPNSSGGSTGKPVNFFQDLRYTTYGRAASYLFMDWMGVRPGDKTAVFWGADRDFKDQSIKLKVWKLFDRVKALNSFSMSDKLVREFLLELNRFRPRYINGYAGSLYLIARTINESTPIEFRPVAVRSSAETLYGFQRREIEEAFGAKVFNFYGSREVNNLAVECPAHDGLHVFASGRIVEIVDAQGRPVSEGELGQVAVTDLTNFSFPFIRYLNGDLAIRRDKPCSCGRGYPMIEKICGRTTDVITVNGQYIHGEYFTHLFYKKPEVRQFQVIQEDPGTLSILVVARDGRADIDDVLAKIREKVGASIQVRVNFTDRIETTGTGKYRFTISRVAWAPRNSADRSGVAANGGDRPERQRESPT